MIAVRLLLASCPALPLRPPPELFLTLEGPGLKTITYLELHTIRGTKVDRKEENLGWAKRAPALTLYEKETRKTLGIEQL